ncbi:LOW QUALITY PROTEIN: acyl-CoA synthetase short-chain family member 3, mitochondrial-like [Amphiura filiformis]|uniref:LOW QUALITY PROTEIN: acyl-CoA synthetase short-chain family member 3, mitochondrial-like n=1 Tax=Amphiura filiformis TaxID=82378 RepID=UPI003B211295
MRLLYIAQRAQQQRLLTKALPRFSQQNHSLSQLHRPVLPPATCKLISRRSLCSYTETHRRSIENPEEFWGEAAENVTWFKKWDRVLDNSNQPSTKWFPGGELNTAYNAVDRHVEQGFGESIAIIHDSPVSEVVEKITYKELQEEVSKLADVLVSLGVQYGDRVLIYMPMIPQAIVAMLATARIGAIHALVFGGFASKELSVRINHAKPKAILSASVGIEPNRTIDYKELLDKAIEMSEHKPKSCIIYNRHQFPSATLLANRDYCWDDVMSKAKGHDCVPVKAMDPLYLLYTSGTTGTPKGVVRPSGGHAVALYWTMKNIYDMNPGEAWWAASDLGWVVGHSYICYAPLLHRNTTVIYEGKPVGTTDPSAFFRVIHDHDVAGMFTAPTALRAIHKDDPTGEFHNKYEMKNLRTLFVAGELCDRETMDWCKEAFKVPVLDHWWQTESGWSITASHVGLGDDLHPRHGVTGKPVPGWDVQVVDKDCKKVEPGTLGRIVVKLPLPPGSMSTLWENEEKFQNLYFGSFPGYYDSMDAGIYYKDDYVSIQARVDDVINVAGHRIAASSLEEAIVHQGDIVECAAIPLKDKLKGHVPIGLCVLKPNIQKTNAEIAKEVIQSVRDSVGPVAAFKKAIIVSKLPKTRSGKISRQTVAAMANGEPFKIPPTIEDATAYDEIHLALKEQHLI